MLTTFVGLERVVMLFLRLGNIRWATLFPNYPRSFPKRSQDDVQALGGMEGDSIRGPIASTVEYAQRKQASDNVPLPRLEDLIAAYGDSPNTLWLDPFWTVWRHPETGGACGYAVSEKFALIWGRPLCDDKHIYSVAKAFIHHLSHEKRLKPIWACIDNATETILTEQLHWNCVVAAAEQRVNPVTTSAEQTEKAVRQKIHHAQREGVKVSEKEDALSEEEQEEVSERIRDWQAERHGTQIYSAGLRPFDGICDFFLLCSPGLT